LGPVRGAAPLGVTPSLPRSTPRPALLTIELPRIEFPVLAAPVTATPIPVLKAMRISRPVCSLRPTQPPFGLTATNRTGCM
jgi:hypothetical protein